MGETTCQFWWVSAQFGTLMKRLVNITTLAEELPFTVRYLRVLVAERKIPFYRMGHKTLRFDVEKVQKALARFEIKEVDAK